MDLKDPMGSGNDGLSPPVSPHGPSVCVLSQVPQDMVLQLCGSYSAAELSSPGPALAELRQAQAAGMSLSLYMEESVQELLRDAAERFKGWMSMPGPQHTELACRKVSTTLPMAAMGLGEGVVHAGEAKNPKRRSSPASVTVPWLDPGRCKQAKQVP